MTVESTGIAWRPTVDYVRKSNVWRFMSRHNIPDYDSLIARSTEDIAWFWDALVRDLGLEFSKPYTQVVDLTRGIEWAKWFIDGKVNIIHNCLDRHAKKNPQKTAVIWHGEDGLVRKESFASLNEKVCKLASAFDNELDLKKDDRVALYMPMLPETVTTLLACLKIGLVCVPIFSGFGPGAAASRINDVGARVVFTADGSFRRGRLIENKKDCDAVIQSTPTVEKVIVVKRGGNSVPWDTKKDAWWDDVIVSGDSSCETKELDSEDLALVLYTSGTTGKPKGAVHTHAGVLVQCAKELGYCFDVKKNDVFFWVTDIGWMMGPWMIVGGLNFGATILIFEGAIDYPTPDRLWKIVEESRVSILGISPTAIRSLRRYGDEYPRKHDLSSLRVLGGTGEPWDTESWTWYFEKIGNRKSPIINISGGTEIIGAFLSPLPITDLKPCTLRGPAPGMDVDVFDEQGNSVRGKVGYLVCKKPSPSMTRGFWNDKERYLETYWRKFPGVWYHGDWASVDKDGFWFLHGRADDVIKISGRRLGPAEIESVLMEHPGVSEAAAIGVPHEVKGETVVCFVVLKPAVKRINKTLKDELSSFVEKRVGKAFSLEEIVFVSALPKTRSGKIVRRLIRSKFLGENMPKDLSSLENPEALQEIAQKV